MLTIIPVPNNLMTPPFRSRSDRTLDAAGGKALRGKSRPNSDLQVPSEPDRVNQQGAPDPNRGSAHDIGRKVSCGRNP